MNNNIKPCPFCGNNDIRYSMKVTGHFDRYYHCQYYCNKCHTYGPRFNSKVVKGSNYTRRSEVEENLFIREKALELWNKRISEVDE